jgi:flagellin
MNANTTSDALEVSRLSVADQGDAIDAIDQIDSALNKMGTVRSSFGAIQSRLQSAVNHLSTQEFNIEEARSKLADTNIAEAVTQLAIGKIQSEIQIAVLAQANQTPQLALRLLA